MSEAKVITGTITNWLVKPTISAVPQEEMQQGSTSEPLYKLDESFTVNVVTQSTRERPLRPQVVSGFTTRYRFGEYGSIYVILNYDIVTNALIEIFITSSKTSPRNRTNMDTLARMISNQIKHGVPMNTVIKHLLGMDEGEAGFVRFPGQKKPLMIKSLADLIGNVLRLYPTYDHLESIVYEEAGLNDVDDAEVGDEVITPNGSGYITSGRLSYEDAPRYTASDVVDMLQEAAEEEGIELPSTFSVDMDTCLHTNVVNQGGCKTCLDCGWSECG